MVSVMLHKIACVFTETKAVTSTKKSDQNDVRKLKMGSELHIFLNLIPSTKVQLNTILLKSLSLSKLCKLRRATGDYPKTLVQFRIFFFLRQYWVYILKCFTVQTSLPNPGRAIQNQCQSFLISHKYKCSTSILFYNGEFFNTQRKD